MNPVNPDLGCSSTIDETENSPPADLTLTADGETPTIRTKPGQFVTIDWSAVDITPGSCTVTGTNGDSWTGDSGSQPTSPITGPTDYVLTCDDLERNPASVTVQVKLFPSFEEF